MGNQIGLPAGTELDRWVRMRRRLNAPPERVLRAWSDPEELARWFPERIEGGMAVGARSMLVWPDRRIWWEILEAGNNRFVFQWPWLADEGLITTVHVAVHPAGYGSRLDLEDGPFPIGQAGVIDAWAEALERWAEALALLRAHLDFSVDLRLRS